MNVILVSNVSANGKVLLSDGSGYRTPQEAMGIFMQAASQAGNIVVGRKTFEIFQNIPGALEGFSGVEMILLSATATPSDRYKVVASAREAIEHLADKGFSQIAVFGGTQTYNAFLDENLVTDILINIHPVMTGKGGILLTRDEITTNFKLVEHKLLNENITQLLLKRSAD
ncbi:MAG: dihydrofolate reductase [Mucilaginibacter sp.]|uniref:dihydrofolate reductase family protein n=1 Tax=Mucilaginibacter sp. TaxID=1882438 RepID=UPI0031B35B7E